jgi:hypothetical protein
VVSLPFLVQNYPIGDEEDDPPIPFVHRGFIPESFALNIEKPEGNIVSVLSKGFTEGNDFFPYLSLDLRIPGTFLESAPPVPQSVLILLSILPHVDERRGFRKKIPGGSKRPRKE